MLDQTINPTSSTFDTIHSIEGLYDLNIPKHERLTPSFFVYEKGQVSRIQIHEDQTQFQIGSREDNEVVIHDPHCSDVQVSIIQIGKQCYFMDCGENDAVQFNGIQKRQEVIPAESRMVMKIGSAWIIYIGIDHQKYDETDSVLLKRSLIKCIKSKNSYGEVLLKLGNHEWYSSSAPILVGSHNSCDYRIEHPDVSPFHFIVYYSPAGLYIEDITHGKPGILLNGSPCRFPVILSEDSLIEVGKLKISAFIYGNIQEQCNFLYSELQRRPGLVLTNLKRSDSCHALPQSNRKLSIGRSDDCNIVLQDNSASKVHAHLMVRDKHVLIQDNHSTNGIYLNRDQINRASIKPGDIVEMGDSCFLLHYQQ